MTAIGDPCGILDRAFIILKQSTHLLLALEVEFLRFELCFVLVVDGMVGLDAQQDIVHPVILFLDIMAVVGGDHTRADLTRNACQSRKDLPLFGDPVILQLDKIVLFTENALVVPCFFDRAPIIIGKQSLRDLSRQTSG